MNIASVPHSKRAYVVVTAVMVVFMAGGAVFDVAKTADAVRLITALGYPEYFIRFIGALKLLGVAAILTPGIPRLKQWAYAGLVFDTGGALFSHANVHSNASKWIPALVALALITASYVLYTVTVDPFNRPES